MLSPYWERYFDHLWRVILPTLMSLSGGVLLWVLYWHFNELLGIKVPWWKLTANTALLGLTGAIFAIPFGTMAQRHTFKSKVERASCVVALCLGVLLLSMLALEIGFTPPLVGFPDTVVFLMFVLYVGCVAFPAIRWLVQPDAKRLTREVRLKDWKRKARKKKRATQKRK